MVKFVVPTVSDNDVTATLSVAKTRKVTLVPVGTGLALSCNSTVGGVVSADTVTLKAGDVLETLKLSVTVTVIPEEVPVAVGVQVIRPVLASMVMPLGTMPVKAYVSGSPSLSVACTSYR